MFQVLSLGKPSFHCSFVGVYLYVPVGCRVLEHCEGRDRK